MKPLPVTWAPPTILTNNNAPQPEVCPQICTMQYDPVCDSNGETHSNKCAFEIAACGARKKNQIIIITKQGSCEAPQPEVCPQICTMQYDPVCDSNGETHSNKCAFEIAACEARKKNQIIVIVKQGSCEVGSSADCMTACTMEFMPVCDSNGITHGNKCAFDIAACEAKKMNMYLTMVKEGPCQGSPNPTATVLYPDPAPTVAIPSREKCVDGTTKKEDCNTCNCVGGIWACTLMACLPPMKPLPVTWAPPTILTN